MLVPEIQTVRSRPKLDEAYLRLESMASALEPGTRLPKVMELCRELDVSVVTLGKALARLEAEGVLSRKHGLGIFTNLTHKHSIHLICDPALFRAADSSPLWSILLDHLKSRAQDADELLSLHFAGFDTGPGVHLDRSLKQDIRLQRMDGVMVVGLNDETTHWIMEQGVKTVGYASKASYRVRNDHAAHICSAVNTLAGAGCTRLAYWSGITPGRTEDVVLTQAEGFTAPFLAALRAHGLDYQPGFAETGLDFVDKKTGAVEVSLREQGFQIAARVFGRPRAQWPEGIIIGNDVTTLGALVAMSKLGVRPGRDVLIVSHANVGSSVLHGYEEELAVIAFDPTKIVHAMFNLMETLLSGRTPPEPMVYVAPEPPVCGSVWNCKVPSV